MPYVECFNCGTEMRIDIEISEREDLTIIACPICEAEDIEVTDE